MSRSGFVEELLDNSNHFYKTALSEFDWWRELNGLTCTVSRLKERDEYRSVFGSIANTTLVDDDSAEKFEYIALFHMNDMLRLFSKSSEQLQMYDNRNILKHGDILTFTRNQQEFKWKVTDIYTFSESEGVLYQYQLGGLTEVDSTRSSDPD